MTQFLEKALAEVAKLPASEQDAVAGILLEELASEQRWSESFAKSQDSLAKLSEQALADYAAGRTKLSRGRAIANNRKNVRKPR